MAPHPRPLPACGERAGPLAHGRCAIPRARAKLAPCRQAKLRFAERSGRVRGRRAVAREFSWKRYSQSRNSGTIQNGFWPGATRAEDRILQGEQLVVRLWRLFDHDVEPGAQDLLVAQRRM